MADPTVDPAEIEAGMEAATVCGCSAGRKREVVTQVLAAVLPDHDARIRADERAKVAEEIPGWTHEQTITSDGGSFWLDCDWCDQPVMPVAPGDSLETLLTSARNHHRVCAIARQHATTREET